METNVSLTLKEKKSQKSVETMSPVEQYAQKKIFTMYLSYSATKYNSLPSSAR